MRQRRCWSLASLLGIIAGLGAGEAAPPVRQIALLSPLNTVVPVERAGADPLRLEADLVVPADAPSDLGASIYVADVHGRWFRSTKVRSLAPGRQHLSFDLGDDAGLIGEPHRAAWGPWPRAQVAKSGLFLWSQQASHAIVTVERLELVGDAKAGTSGTKAVAATATPVGAAAVPGRLLDLALDGFDAGAGVARAVTGARWSLSVRPDPFTSQPYDPARFQLTAVITGPDGQQRRINGFYRQTLTIQDRGDREQGLPTGAGRFEVRFRPGLPGAHHLRLEASWQGGAPQVTVLPDLMVAGEPWDDVVRVDPVDPRFFSTGSRLGKRDFFWPVGINLHSVWDLRTRDACGTKLTPHRLWNSYEAYLRRLAAGGGNAAEIWLASWSLILEWRGDWDGFHGVGSYSEENAERLDRVLDLARELGIRVNLVINNHGQASDSTDREWHNNPWNSANGGPLSGAERYFTDPASLAGQERLRRYLVARYADHPAVMGWKLWSEQNLTAGGGNLRQWHVNAAERWQLLDSYDHGVTTHWAGDYHSPDRAIVAQPGMDYICIDAYHGRGVMLAQLVSDGLIAGDGLGIFRKPILVTEYGGSPGACPEPQLIAEHHSGAWAGMVSGNAGAPMLWWFEWVDQRDRYHAYGAITRFLAGEDLRGADSRPVVLGVSGGVGPLWARAWSRPGRILGYLLDHEWGLFGEVKRTHPDVRVRVGDSIQPGAMVAEWWDADAGAMVRRDEIAHPGGALDLAAPPFARHLAFKLMRQAPATAQVKAAGDVVR
jgi:hypothetical protein